MKRGNVDATLKRSIESCLEFFLANLNPQLDQVRVQLIGKEKNHFS